MKLTHILSVVGGCLSLSLASIACGGSLNSVHIGLSPYQSAEEAKAIRRNVGQFILEAPANTSVVVHDAYGLSEIARFQIPQLRFDSPGERAQRMSEPFGKLANWYKQQPGRDVSPLLSGSGAVRIPEFLQNLSQQATGEPYAVLMIGNPINLSVEEPSFSMVGGKVPSDGHLQTNVAASIYGTAEKVGQLHRCTVHFCYLREDIWANRLVKESVQRFWGLFISRQGGALVDFTADLSRALSTVTQNGLVAVGNYQLDPEDSILDMRVVNERTIPVRAVKKVAIVSVPVVTPVVTILPPKPIPVYVAITNTVEEVHAIYQTNIVVREVEVVKITAAPVVTNVPAIPVAPRGRIGIAIWWPVDVDIDAHVSVPGQRELYYGYTEHKYGKYFRDIRQANLRDTDQAWRDRWEYVEISEKAPVEGLSCWLNLYKVNRRATGPITGKVRVQHADGRMSESTFSFTVMKGNGGADLSCRNSSPYWVKVNLGEASNEDATSSIALRRR